MEKTYVISYGKVRCPGRLSTVGHLTFVDFKHQGGTLFSFDKFQQNSGSDRHQMYDRMRECAEIDQT